MTKPLPLRCDSPQCCRLHRDAWLLYLAAIFAVEFMNDLTSVFEHATIPALGQLRAVIDKIEGDGDDERPPALKAR